MKWDFGASFIHRPGMPQNAQTLEIYNKDRRDIGIDCKFEGNPWLDFEFEPCILKPGHNSSATFVFKPAHARAYSQTVEFIVNGLSSYNVEISGQERFSFELFDTPKREFTAPSIPKVLSC